MGKALTNWMNLYVLFMYIIINFILDLGNQLRSNVLLIEVSHQHHPQ